jgi:CheY-like chemotaxis protein
MKVPIPTLLVIDDNEPTRNAYKRMFTRCGYFVLLAKDGQDALNQFGEKIREGGVDVVLSDVDMPIMNGIEFQQAARVLCPNLPFVFLSGKSHPELRDEVLLLKPAKEAEIANALLRVLQPPQTIPPPSGVPGNSD